MRRESGTDVSPTATLAADNGEREEAVSRPCLQADGDSATTGVAVDVTRPEPALTSHRKLQGVQLTLNKIDIFNISLLSVLISFQICEELCSES